MDGCVEAPAALYQVAAVIGKRTVKGGGRISEVLVLWEDFGIECATWEPILNIPTVFVDRFEGGKLPDPDLFDGGVEEEGEVEEAEDGRRTDEQTASQEFLRQSDGPPRLRHDEKECEILAFDSKRARSEFLQQESAPLLSRRHRLATRLLSIEKRLSQVQTKKSTCCRRGGGEGRSCRSDRQPYLVSQHRRVRRICRRRR